jgi:hypothetical protein
MPFLPRTERERMPILVFALGVMWAFWVISWSWLMRRLRTRHPVVYHSLGYPGLIGERSMRSSVLFTDFLLGLRFRQLPDPLLVRVCWLMVVFSLSYLPLFVGLSFLIFWGAQMD